jgi:phosphate transport system permease protein
MKRARIQQWAGFASILLSAAAVLFFLGVLLTDVVFKGFPILSFEFLFAFPRNGMTEGGILPVLVGTLWVTLLTAVAAVPVGVATALYLHEYASDNFVTRIVRSSIRNLAGVPSVIYGLFGVVLFVDALSMGTSLLASGLTLGLLTLPVVVASSEEALRNVPSAYREASYALGATQWETVWHHVLPAAKRGILTGIILGLSRSAGETAPILFTGVTFYQRFLPATVYDEFMAMPYHIFILSTQHHSIEQVRGIAYGTALVLMCVILLLNLFALVLRTRSTRK